MNKQIEQIILISKHPDVFRELRVLSIMVFTDYSLRSDDIENEQFNKIIEIIYFALQYCIDTSTISEDEDILEYKIVLKDYILDFFSASIKKEKLLLNSNFIDLIKILLSHIYNSLNDPNDYQKIKYFDIISDLFSNIPSFAKTHIDYNFYINLKNQTENLLSNNLKFDKLNIDDSDRSMFYSNDKLIESYFKR